MQLDEASRINLVKALLLDPGEGWLKSLQERYNVKLYLLSTSARIQSGQGEELGNVVRAMEANGECQPVGNRVAGHPGVPARSADGGRRAVDRRHHDRRETDQ